MFLPSPPSPGGKKWPLSNQEIITPLIFFRQKRNHVVWPEGELAFIKERTTYNGAIPSYDLIKTVALIARRLHALNKTLFIPRIDPLQFSLPNENISVRVRHTFWNDLLDFYHKGHVLANLQLCRHQSKYKDSWNWWYTYIPLLSDATEFDPIPLNLH